jgi:hypothetical protein
LNAVLQYKKTVIKIPINKIRLIDWLPTGKTWAISLTLAQSLRRRGDADFREGIGLLKMGSTSFYGVGRRLEAAHGLQD